MRKLLLILPVLFITSCDTTDTAKAVLAACNTWAGALSQLAVLRSEGKLTENQIATINTIVPLANSACETGGEESLTRLESYIGTARSFLGDDQ